MTYENGTDVAADAAIDTQLQQYGTNILAGSDSSATATESSLISLGVSTVETDEDGRRRRRRLKLVSRRRSEEKKTQTWASLRNATTDELIAKKANLETKLR